MGREPKAKQVGALRAYVEVPLEAFRCTRELIEGGSEMGQKGRQRKERGLWNLQSRVEQM
eukprot:3873067-Amphidinium_carterae.1